MPTATVESVTTTEPPRRARTLTARAQSGLTSNTGAKLTSYLLLVVIWTVAAQIVLRIPTPFAVADFLVREAADGEVVYNFVVSIGRYFTGVAIAVTLGAVVGILSGLSKFWRAFSGDVLMVGLALPAIIWAFLAVMWFGLGGTAQVWATVLAATPFVAVNVMHGARSLPRELRDMSDAYRVSLFRQVRYLVVPGIMGYLAAGVRFAMIIGWNTILLSEWFGGTDGVGFRARYWYDANQYAGFAAWVVLFIVFVVLIDRGFLTPLLKRANRWQRDTSERDDTDATTHIRSEQTWQNL